MQRLAAKQSFRLAAKSASNGEPLALSGGKAADLPFKAINSEPQRFDRRYRVRLRRKVVAYAIRPPSGLGGN